MVHGSRHIDWGGIVGKWPDHMQVAGHRVHEVQSQVTESHKGVTKETETLPRHDESALVLLSFLSQKTNHFRPHLNYITNKQRLVPFSCHMI